MRTDAGMRCRPGPVFCICDHKVLRVRDRLFGNDGLRLAVLLAIGPELIENARCDRAEELERADAHDRDDAADDRPSSASR